MKVFRKLVNRSYLLPILGLLLVSGILIATQINSRQPVSSRAAISNPNADINSDGVVNLLDYTILFENFAKNPLDNPKADLNSDGVVNILDYGILFASWGQTNVSLTATATPIQLNSPTPISSSPSPTTVQTIVEGIPVCTDHDYTKWHTLVKKNADGSVNCTYTHDHKNDPRQLDDIFGPVGQYTGGQEISYPWQTHSALGPENVAKHRVYNWEVVRVTTCKPSFATFGFDAARRETHSDGVGGATVNDPSGATTRFHSFFFQGRVCDPNDQSYHGTITIGGHMDTNALFLGNDFLHVPLPGDPPVVEQRNGRFHMIANPDGTLPPQNRNGDFTWYYQNCTVVNPGSTCFGISGGIRKEDWGGVDPGNPSKVLLANPQSLNGSYIEPIHLVGLNIQGYYDTIDGKADGVINFTGFTDRYGNLTQSCSPIGADCIPIKLENLKIGSYQFRADANGINSTEYDVKAPNGKTLITFPN